jgi:hypothetical protein
VNDKNEKQEPTSGRPQLFEMCEWQRRAGLKSLDRYVASNLADDGQVQQLSDQKTLVIFQFGYHDLKKVVGLARDQMTGNNFRHLDDGALEGQCMFVGMAVDLDDYKNRKPAS